SRGRQIKAAARIEMPHSAGTTCPAAPSSLALSQSERVLSDHRADRTSGAVDSTRARGRQTFQTQGLPAAVNRHFRRARPADCQATVNPTERAGTIRPDAAANKEQ